MKEIQTGNVTRYCRPTTLDNDKRPTSSAFVRRKEPNEKYLSVYLLDWFNRKTEVENVRAAQAYMETKGFKFKPSGSFAVLNIHQSKQHISQENSLEIFYREENLPHCGIFHEADDLLIAKLLAECVQNNYAIKDLTNSSP